VAGLVSDAEAEVAVGGIVSLQPASQVGQQLLQSKKPLTFMPKLIG